jgi:hypothetical protein
LSFDRCRRLKPFVLVSVLLALVALGLHKAEHGSALQETPCLLCVSADHLGGTPAHNLDYTAHVPRDKPLRPIAQSQTASTLVSPYESRAPPPSS